MSFPGEINFEYLVAFFGVTFIIVAIGSFSHATWMRKRSTRTIIWAYLIWSLLLFFWLFGGALWDIERTEFLHYWSVPLLIASSFLGAEPRDHFQPIQKMLAIVPLVLLMPAAYVVFVITAVVIVPFAFFAETITAPFPYLKGLLSLIVPFVVTYIVAVLLSRVITASPGQRLAALRRSPFK